MRALLLLLAAALSQQHGPPVRAAGVPSCMSTLHVVLTLRPLAAPQRMVKALRRKRSRRAPQKRNSGGMSMLQWNLDSRLLLKIFSMGTSCTLHQATVMRGSR